MSGGFHVNKDDAFNHVTASGPGPVFCDSCFTVDKTRHWNNVTSTKPGPFFGCNGNSNLMIAGGGGNTECDCSQFNNQPVPAPFPVDIPTAKAIFSIEGGGSMDTTMMMALFNSMFYTFGANDEEEEEGKKPISYINTTEIIGSNSGGSWWSGILHTADQCGDETKCATAPEGIMQDDVKNFMPLNSVYNGGAQNGCTVDEDDRMAFGMNFYNYWWLEPTRKHLHLENIKYKGSTTNAAGIVTSVQPRLNGPHSNEDLQKLAHGLGDAAASDTFKPLEFMIQEVFNNPETAYEQILDRFLGLKDTISQVDFETKILQKFGLQGFLQNMRELILYIIYFLKTFLQSSWNCAINDFFLYPMARTMDTIKFNDIPLIKEQRLGSYVYTMMATCAYRSFIRYGNPGYATLIPQLGVHRYPSFLSLTQVGFAEMVNYQWDNCFQKINDQYTEDGDKTRDIIGGVMNQCWFYKEEADQLPTSVKCMQTFNFPKGADNAGNKVIYWKNRVGVGNPCSQTNGDGRSVEFESDRTWEQSCGDRTVLEAAQISSAALGIANTRTMLVDVPCSIIKSFSGGILGCNDPTVYKQNLFGVLASISKANGNPDTLPDILKGIICRITVGQVDRLITGNMSLFLDNNSYCTELEEGSNPKEDGNRYSGVSGKYWLDATEKEAKYGNGLIPLLGPPGIIPKDEFIQDCKGVLKPLDADLSDGPGTSLLAIPGSITNIGNGNYQLSEVFSLNFSGKILHLDVDSNGMVGDPVDQALELNLPDTVLDYADPEHYILSTSKLTDIPVMFNGVAFADTRAQWTLSYSTTAGDSASIKSTVMWGSSYNLESGYTILVLSSKHHWPVNGWDAAREAAWVAAGGAPGTIPLGTHIAAGLVDVEGFLLNPEKTTLQALAGLPHPFCDPNGWNGIVSPAVWDKWGNGSLDFPERCIISVNDGAPIGNNSGFLPTIKAFQTKYPGSVNPQNIHGYKLNQDDSFSFETVYFQIGTMGDSTSNFELPDKGLGEDFNELFGLTFTDKNYITPGDSIYNSTNGVVGSGIYKRSSLFGITLPGKDTGVYTASPWIFGNGVDGEGGNKNDRDKNLQERMEYFDSTYKGSWPSTCVYTEYKDAFEDSAWECLASKIDMSVDDMFKEFDATNTGMRLARFEGVTLRENTAMGIRSGKDYFGEGNHLTFNITVVGTNASIWIVPLPELGKPQFTNEQFTYMKLFAQCVSMNNSTNAGTKTWMENVFFGGI